jgi:hypothetical protein
MKRRNADAKGTRSHGGWRAGYTLIEMVLYISMVGFFSSLFAVLLHRANQARHETTTMLLDARQLHRFHRDWTEDVHAATEAELLPIDANHVKLRLQLHDGTFVEYLLDLDRIRRHQWSGDALIHQEAYVVDDPLEVEWILEQSDGLLEVKLWEPNTERQPHSLRRQIVARLGSQRRYLEGAFP